VSLFYLDTSAALKLLNRETHSVSFARFYDQHAGDLWVSSTLLRVETMRSVRRSLPAAIADARDLLEAFDYVSIDDEIIEAALAEPDPLLRSLDVLHLATARTLGVDLDALVTYDDRLAAAARGAGMTIMVPHD
jgi:predicted nucleic acid-binding protein